MGNKLLRVPSLIDFFASFRFFRLRRNKTKVAILSAAISDHSPTTACGFISPNLVPARYDRLILGKTILEKI